MISIARLRQNEATSSSSLKFKRTMYTHRIEPFGKFEKHILQNDNGDALEMTPQYGACLLDLRFDGMSVLDGYRTPEELIENKWSKNVVLVPFPNRLRDGRFEHLGKTYQFDINNAATGNAIHGFGKDAPMTVKKVKVSENEASICCIWQYDGSREAFPFRFTFETTMILRGGNFEMEMKIRNDNQVPMPAGLGWHPYFRMADNVADVSLKMPFCEAIEIDERMLPTGKKTPFFDYWAKKPIGKATLDNGFFISKEEENFATTYLESERGQLAFWQEIGAAKWNFLQIFTPPHRQSIAIEPMTCNIDAFNNHDGLVILTPRATLEGRFGVRFS